MGIRKKGLVLAMESEDASMDGVNSDETMLAADEAVDDANEEVADIEELDDAVDDAENDAETLDRIKDTMEDSVESGEGLSETAAEIAEVAVESICSRLGMSTSRTMPALESFGSSSSRVTATKIAIEGVKDKIMQILKAIKAAIVNLYKSIVAFFKGYHARVKLLKENLTALKTKAKDKDWSNGLKDAELSNAGLAKTFSVEKVASPKTAKDILAKTNTILTASKDMVSSVSKGSTAVTSMSYASSTSANEMAKKLSTVVDSIAGGVDEISGVLKTKETSDTGEVTYTKFGPLIAGKKLSMEVTEPSDDDEVTTVAIKVEVADGFKPAEKITACEQADCTSVIDAALVVTDTLLIYAKEEKELGKISSILTKASDNAIKALSSQVDGDGVKQIKIAQKSIRSLNSISAKLGGTIPSLALNTVKKASDYVNASVSNVKAS